MPASRRTRDAGREPAEDLLFHRSLRRLSDRVIRLSKVSRDRRAADPPSKVEGASRVVLRGMARWPQAACRNSTRSHWPRADAWLCRAAWCRRRGTCSPAGAVDLRHRRLRRVLFRSRHLMGGGRRRDPQAARAARASRRQGRDPQPGARASLVSRKHGLPYPPLRCSTDGIDRFLTQNTQVGIRRTRDGFDVYAPHGFDDVADLIVRPNPGPNFSAANYAAKAARWKTLWPEITVMRGRSRAWVRIA